MENKTELKNEIENCKAEISRLNAAIAAEDDSDVFGRMTISDLQAEIRSNERMIARLQDRINDAEDSGPTDAQIRNAEYVNSDAYDND
jgi:chromosome segregation ATPase